MIVLNHICKTVILSMKNSCNFSLQIQALKKLSAFTVNLTYNLEPCYTILLAFIFFGEARELNFSFYVGIVLVVLSVLLQTWKGRK